MARYFNGTADCLTLADSVALTLPNGNHSIGGWCNPDSVTTAYQDFLGWGVYTSNPSLTINLYFSTLRVRACDASVDVSLSGDVATTDWQHVLFQRNGNTLSLYRNGVLVDSVEQVGFGAIDVPDSLYLGARSGPSTYFGGSLAEWAKWDAALTSEEIARLVAGVRAVDIGRRPAWYLPMCDGLHEEINAVAVNNFGTDASENPPRTVYPSTPRVLRASSSFIAGPYQVLAAETGVCGTAAAGVFFTGITRGQVNEQ